MHIRDMMKLRWVRGIVQFPGMITVSFKKSVRGKVWNYSSDQNFKELSMSQKLELAKNEADKLIDRCQLLDCQKTKKRLK